MSIKFYSDKCFTDWLVTLAIGDDHLSRFEMYALPFARKYCLNNNLGLAVVVSDIDSETLESSKGKKKNWQKLLIPDSMSKLFSHSLNITYFDSDILFNPFGKNIFDNYKSGKFAIVSEVHDLPYDTHLCNRVISFYRHHFYSQNYPLDSAIFMKHDDIYAYHNLPVRDDYSTSGVFVCNTEIHSHELRDIYCRYNSNVQSLTDGGDEPHFNHEVRELFDIQTLPYEFQALWSWEMASRFRHLFSADPLSKDSMNCVSSTLLSVTALHFAGAWPDSRFYLNPHLFSLVDNSFNSAFHSYLQQPVTGNPVGRVFYSE